jgi:hypothetical protein
MYMKLIPTTWLVPVATAAWAVWTWAHGHALEQERERARITALYVNPFLSACEDLQSRIYKILELDGLAQLRERYPDGSYAEETLYLIVRLFGWLAAVSRYGPYTQDSVMIRHATALRRAFATSSGDRTVGAFNFFPAEQKALGKMVMQNIQGEFGHEMDTISYYEFRDIIQSPYRMPESSAVAQTLEALHKATSVEDLEGWERLAEAQGHLVDLLRYLEKKEGYSYFPRQRKKCRQCQALQAPAQDDAPSPAQSG